MLSLTKFHLGMVILQGNIIYQHPKRTQICQIIKTTVSHPTGTEWEEWFKLFQSDFIFASYILIQKPNI